MWMLVRDSGAIGRIPGTWELESEPTSFFFPCKLRTIVPFPFSCIHSISPRRLSIFKDLKVEFWATTVCHLHVIVIIGPSRGFYFYVKSFPLSALFDIVISCLVAQVVIVPDPKTQRETETSWSISPTPPLLHSAPVDPRCPHSQTSFSLTQGCDSLPFTFPFFVCMNRRSWDGIVVEKKIFQKICRKNLNSVCVISETYTRQRHSGSSQGLIGATSRVSADRGKKRNLSSEVLSCSYTAYPKAITWRSWRTIMPL